ncbi:ABC1-domain-containing protein [Sanghuangporus baumii]|uniref:ABC1-domain-containing protein n=1 Tax=Sanghuangporus baumii TaxID=108892 RepID=A0A9Q5I087_SANBA|nr:ABC1-domain-containing protein [Sanghuangporus baumii]
MPWITVTRILAVASSVAVTACSYAAKSLVQLALAAQIARTNGKLGVGRRHGQPGATYPRKSFGVENRAKEADREASGPLDVEERHETRVSQADYAPDASIQESQLLSVQQEPNEPSGLDAPMYADPVREKPIARSDNIVRSPPTDTLLSPEIVSDLPVDEVSPVRSSTLDEPKDTEEVGKLEKTKLADALEITESVPISETEAKLLQSELLPKSSQPLSHTQRNLQASRVPSSRIGRLFHYGGLAASLGYGAASEAFRRVSSSQGEGQSSLMMTPANVKRLVEKLSKMRGAALKLGQFMSIQDTHLLPKDVEEVFRRVQDSAHYMPNWQMERVMSGSLGSSWESNFASFDRVPFAAASLGQVHSAVLAAHASPTGKDEMVAIKIQFPDIAKSIESDLGYLKLLLNAGKILPRGLFLDKTLQAMKGELADECDYTREAACARFFGSQTALGKDRRFRIPWVWEGSTERVLVMQQMDGVSVGGNIVDNLSQESRDQIASTILELCMKELFDFRMMQTDPNWSNFLWNEQRRQIELIDFGATRSYSKEFIDKWMRILQAAVAEDYDACVHWSLELGYIKGGESKTMLDAHIRSLTLLATPFRAHKPASSELGADGRYAFGRGTHWARITAEIRSLIPVMLRERLTPPPRETYSLNRKLSGAFLLASRLGARVDCKSIWESTVEKHDFAQPS